MTRDFDWHEALWAVIKEDGTFAGVPCRSYEEARELANQHEGSHVFDLLIDYDDDSERYPEAYEYDDEPYNIDDDFGFDPYEGCYTYDC